MCTTGYLRMSSHTHHGKTHFRKRQGNGQICRRARSSMARTHTKRCSTSDYGGGMAHYLEHTSLLGSFSDFDLLRKLTPTPVEPKTPDAQESLAPAGKDGEWT